MAETEPAVTVPEVEAPVFDPLTIDLKIPDLGATITTQRGVALSAGADLSEDFMPLPNVIRRHTKRLGITEAQLREAADAQGFDFDYYVAEIGKKGRRADLVLGELEASRVPALTTAPEVRKTQARGQQVAEYGYARAKKGEGRTVEETGVIPDELTDVIRGRDQSYRILDYDEVEGTDAVVKPGSKQFEEVIQTTGQLLDENTEAGRMRAALVEKWGQNIILESGLMKYVEPMATYYTEKQAKKRGLDEFNPEYDKLYHRSRARALREVALMKTSGKWVAPTWMSWEKIFPDQRVSEDDDPWLNKAWDRASRVRVELVGIDNRGEPVFQLTNPVWHIFEMSDVVQSAAAGALSELGDEDDQRSIMDRLGRGTLEGIEKRQTFMDAALATDVAREDTMAAFALGTAGFAATILTPDLLFGLGTVARAAKKTASAIGAIKDLRRVAKAAVPNMATAALKRAKAEEILAQAEEAFQAGRMDEAKRYLEESLPLLEVAERAEKDVRKTGPGVMDQVDSMDSAIYHRAVELTPEIGSRAGKRIGDILGGRFGNLEEAVHPSMRRREARIAQGGESLVGYQEYYDTSRIVRGLISTVDDIQAGRFRHIRDAMNETGKLRGGAYNLLKKGDLNRAAIKDDPEVFKLWADFHDYIDDAANAPLLLSNPQEWVAEASRRFSQLAQRGTADGFDATATAAAMRHNLEKTAEAVANIKVRQIEDKPRLTGALVGAVRSVRANTETRAAALIFIREQVSSQALMQAEPIIAKASGKFEEFKTLTPMARRYMKQIKKVFDVTDEQALVAARMMDMRAHRWAREEGRAAVDWYTSRFPKEAFKGKEEFIAMWQKHMGEEVGEGLEMPADLAKELKNALKAVEKAEAALKKAQDAVGDAKAIGDSKAVVAAEKVFDEAKAAKDAADEAFATAEQTRLTASQAAKDALKALTAARRSGDAGATDTAQKVRDDAVAAREVATSQRDKARRAATSTGKKLEKAKVVLEAAELSAPKAKKADTAALLKAEAKLVKAKGRLDAAKGAVAKFIDESQTAAVSGAIDFTATNVLDPQAFLKRLAQLKKKGAVAQVWVEGWPETQYAYRDVIKASSAHAVKVVDEAAEGATFTLDDLLLPEFKAVLVHEVRRADVGSKPLLEALGKMADDGITDAFKMQTEDIKRVLRDEDILFQAIDGVNPIFYSRLEQLAQEMPSKMGVNDVVRFLSGRGAKAEEIKWTNIQEFLDDAAAQGKKSITKEELLEHLANNRVVVDEVTAGMLPRELKLAQGEVLAALVATRAATDDLFGLTGATRHQFTTNARRTTVGLESRVALEYRRVLRYAYKNASQNEELLRKIDDWRPLDHSIRVGTVGNVRELLESQSPAQLDELAQILATPVKPQTMATTERVRDIIEDLLPDYVKMRRVLETPEGKKWVDLQRKARGMADDAGVDLLHYEDVTLPGGTNYREVKITLREAEAPKFTDWLNKKHGRPLSPAGSKAELADLDAFDALPRDQQDKLMALYRQDNAEALAASNKEPFTHNHWPDDSNILVHFRAKTRIDTRGRTILFIEEIQSDWHQAGRVSGYRSDVEVKLAPLETALARLERETKLSRDWSKAHPNTDSVQLGRRLEYDDDLFKDGRALGDVAGDARQAKIDTLSPSMRKAWDDYAEWEKARYAFFAEGSKRVSEHGRVLNRTPIQDAQSDVVNAGDQVGLRLTATIEGAGADLRPGFTYLNSSALLEGDALRRDARAIQGRHAVPDAPFKDTKAWAGLAVKRIMRMAADEGFDGVAFTSGIGAHRASGMPLESGVTFYDEILPSVVKKHTKAPLGKTTFRSLEPQLSAGQIARGQRVVDKPLFNFVELTPEVKKRVVGPQVLFQRTAPKQTGWEMQELGEGLVELTSAEIRAARQAGEAPAAAKLPETPEEIDAAWNAIHEGQNFAEVAMLRLQRGSGDNSPMYNYAAENVGDIIQRMTNTRVGKSPGMFVFPKIRAARDNLHMIEDSIEMQLRRNRKNIEQAGLTIDEARENMRRLGQEYADAHRTLPVYNELQRLANDAAIAFGEWRFEDARVALDKLLPYGGDTSDFAARAWRVEPEFARPGAAAARAPEGVSPTRAEAFLDAISEREIVQVDQTVGPVMRVGEGPSDFVRLALNRGRDWISGTPPSRVDAYVASHPDDVSLSAMQTLLPEDRRSGLGTKALTTLRGLADEFGVRIVGNPDNTLVATKRTPQKKLEAWYRKHGLKPYAEHRLPGETNQEMIARIGPETTGWVYVPEGYSPTTTLRAVEAPAAAKLPEIPAESAAYEGQMQVGRVLFDSKNGLGNVPNNSNVAYMGFVVWMKPRDFIGLNPSRGAEDAAGAVAATRRAIEEGQGVAPPFLTVDLVTEGADAGSFKVHSHEGRGRTMAINEIDPDTPVPVHMFGRGEIDRGTDITPEMLEGLVDPGSRVRILADRRVPGGGEIKPDAAWHVPDGPGYDPNYLPTGKVYRSTPRAPEAPAEVMGGGLVFKMDGNTLRVQSSELPEAMRGKGIGQELYLRALRHAQEKGFDFASDIAPSPDAIAAYERLIEAGIPLTRKTVEAEDGKMVQQFVATADDLAAEAPTPRAPGAPAAGVVEAATDTPAFKSWFGGSKVVDDAGEPLVVYHGGGDIEGGTGIFRVSSGSKLGAGIYFTPEKAQAAGYLTDPRRQVLREGAGAITEAYVSIKNPLILRDPTGHPVVNGLVKLGMDEDAALRLVKRAEEKYGYIGGELQQAARKQGYDGIIRYDSTGRMSEIVAFEPTQIKSKFNRGTFDPTDARILFQEVPEGVKGATEFLEDGRSFIYALDGADFSTFVHEFGHVMRRDLDDKGMDAVTDWVKSKGVKVTHKGGRFIGDKDAVKEAEELFARGFEKYVMEGKPPLPSLRDIFEKMKQWMVDIYRGVKQSEEMGEVVDLNISPALRKVFDDLLQEAPPRRSLLPRTLELIRREMAGPPQKGARVDAAVQIASELRRAGGHDISADDILEQVVAVQLGKKEFIELPAPVYMAGGIQGQRFPEGKSQFTLKEFTNLQGSMETSSLLLKQAATKVPLTAKSQAIQEMKPSEMVDNWIKSADNEIMKIARNWMIGGDPIEDMRHLKPEVRARILSGSRLVEQAIGDSVKLIEEGDFDGLFRLLAGDLVRHKAAGRQALSSGHDMMASAAASIGRVLDNADTKAFRRAAEIPDEKGSPGDIIAGFFDKLGDTGPYKTVAELVQDPDYKLASKIISTLVENAKRSTLGDIFEAAGITSGTLLKNPAKDLKVIEAIFYTMGYSRRNGKRLVDTLEDPASVAHSQAQAVALYAELRAVYGTSEKAAKEGIILANRVMSLVAGHGMAEKAQMRWVELGIAADENTMTAFKAWVNGEAVDNAEMLARVEQLYQVNGYNPKFTEITMLEGITGYVPGVARKKLDDALARAMDPDVTGNLSSDLIEQIGGGTARGTSGQRAFAWSYRYMKTRMVRGHYVLKSRYFWMNTMDHFNQIALVAGYRPATVSTMRLLPQNLLANPLSQVVLTGIQKAGYEGAPEKVRSILTAAGNKGADWASTILRSSKWRIDLNDILEAGGKDIRTGKMRPTTVIIGGRVYDTLDIRQTMLEEAIFSSFDTSQLGIKIKKTAEQWAKEARTVKMDPKTGEAIIGERAQSIAQQLDPRTLSKISEDIAEGWAERERAGAVITLMEMGLDPRTACRVTIDALYDYAGSMSKFDRHILMNLFFPFWAFQKNANRQIFNTVFSPAGAYRLGVMRRAYTEGSEVLSSLLYQSTVDEFGLDYNNMDSDTRRQYDMMRYMLVEEYGTMDKVPPAVQQDIRNWISGVITDRALGDGQIRAMPELKNFLLKTGRLRLSDYYVAEPNAKYERFYRQGRPALRVPYPLQKSVKKYVDLLRIEDRDAPFTTIFLPEPMYESAFKHMGYSVASLILAIHQFDSFTGINLLTDKDDGISGVDFKDPLLEVADPSRMMIVPQVLETLDIKTMAYPTALHPIIGRAAESANFDVLVLEATDDALAEISAIREAEAAGEERPEKAGVIRDPRYYLMPGMPQLFYSNSPLMELNRILLQMEQTPMEERGGLRGDLVMWARAALGLETEEVYRHRAIKFTRSAAEKEVGSKKTKEKIQKGRKIRRKDEPPKWPR